MHIPDGDLDLLAVGEAIVDLISRNEINSLSEATCFCRYPGGSPANIASYVAKLGGKSALIAKVGTQAFGQFLKAELQKSGVLTDYLIMDPRVQTTTIFISRTSGTADSDARRDADYHLEPAEIPEVAIKRAKIIHASAFALSREPSRSAVKKALKLARQHKKIISFDPNYNPQIWDSETEAQKILREIFRYTTITKPSFDDAARLFGAGKTAVEYTDLYHAMGPEIVVFTMGTRGVLLSLREQKYHIAARPVKVADATGAGDAFWAGFLVALLDGKSLKECTLFAREIAERKLTTVGPLETNIARNDVYTDIENLYRENFAS